MRADRRSRRTRRRGGAARPHLLGRALVIGALLVGGAACGAAEPPTGSSSSSRSSSAPTSSAPTSSASPSPSAAPDGASLRSLGFRNGPLDTFTVPQGSVLRTAVDQPNVVTLVLSWPRPEDVSSHLLRTLPENGFRVTADDPATRTFTFAGPASGPRWTGTYTATGSQSAIVLRAS